jgi:hypothetical protein
VVRLSTRDPELREYQPVKEWLAYVQTAIYTLFAKTNYYDMTKMQYADLGTMGVGCTLGLEHPEVSRGVASPAGRNLLHQPRQRASRQSLRAADAADRRASLQLVGGDTTKVERRWCNAYDKAITRRRPAVHVIERNDDASGNAVARRREAVALDQVGDRANDKNVLLSEKGFDSQPFTAPRWETVGDQVYCDTSPGFDALPDLRDLQLTARRKGRAMDGMVKPPLAAPAGLRAPGSASTRARSTISMR